MNAHVLRLLVADQEPSLFDKSGWYEEPVFSLQESLPGTVSDRSYWDLMWHGGSRQGRYSTDDKEKSSLGMPIYFSGNAFRPASAPDTDYRHRSAIAARIDKLRQLSLASGDLFDETSAQIAYEACGQLATEVKPALFLLPNGNLRAFWRNEQRESLGIQFLPNGDLQYVILRQGRTKMLQTLGVEEDVEGLTSKVRCFGMERLWSNGKR